MGGRKLVTDDLPHLDAVGLAELARLENCDAAVALLWYARVYE
jgi:hypothetical protein